MSFIAPLLIVTILLVLGFTRLRAWLLESKTRMIIALVGNIAVFTATAVMTGALSSLIGEDVEKAIFNLVTIGRMRAYDTSQNTLALRTQIPPSWWRAEVNTYPAEERLESTRRLDYLVRLTSGLVPDIARRSNDFIFTVLNEQVPAPANDGGFPLRSHLLVLWYRECSTAGCPVQIFGHPAGRQQSEELYKGVLANPFLTEARSNDFVVVRDARGRLLNFDGEKYVETRPPLAKGPTCDCTRAECIERYPHRATLKGLVVSSSTHILLNLDVPVCLVPDHKEEATEHGASDDFAQYLDVLEIRNGDVDVEKVHACLGHSCTVKANLFAADDAGDVTSPVMYIDSIERIDQNAESRLP